MSYIDESVSPFHMPERSKITLPNPSEALNLGYALHVLDDPAYATKSAHLVAEKRVKQFLEIQTKPGSPERAYYEFVADIVTSLGCGITRRKYECAAVLQDALTERNKRIDELQENKKSSDGLSIVFRLLKPAALLLGGILVAQLVGLFTDIGVMVKSSAAAQTSTALGSLVVTVIINLIASILTGVIFVVLWRSLSTYWTAFRNRRIDRDFRVMRSLIKTSYKETEVLEDRLYLEQLRRAWQRYSGEEYPETITYVTVAEGELEMFRRFEQQVQIADANELRGLIRLIRRVSGKRKPPRQPKFNVPYAPA